MAYRTEVRRVNNDLSELGRAYYESLPLMAVDSILLRYGFNALSQGIYCGRSGQINEEVGRGVWIALSWYRMEVSGRYEVVAYVS
jgi:hypothetical protein